MAVGGIFAGVAIRKTKWTDSRLLWIGAGICAVAEGISGLFAVPAVVVVAIAIFGVGQNFFGISENTVIQRISPERRGPVFAVMAVLITVLYPLASLATAQMARLTSIGVPFISGGVIAFMFVLLWGRRRMRA